VEANAMNRLLKLHGTEFRGRKDSMESNIELKYSDGKELGWVCLRHNSEWALRAMADE